MSIASCVWCGGRPVTREDVLPKWLSKILTEAFPADDRYDFASVISTEAGDGPARTFRQAAPEVVVKAACTTCNSGWMAKLEEETKPFLQLMVRGEQVRLSDVQQGTLARWAAKVAVLLDHHEAGATVLGPTDIEQIRNGHAPLGFHVQLALREDDEGKPFDVYTALHYAAPAGTGIAPPSDPPANSFSATLGIGHTAITVVGGPGVENPARWIEGSARPLTIWPPTMAGLEWPPSFPVLRGRGALRRFHESFWDTIANPEFPRPDASKYVADIP